MRPSTCGIACLLFLNACEEPAPTPAPIRPVLTTIVETRGIGESITLTGHIRAQDEVSLAFRIDGKLIERFANVGDRVVAGQLVAKLDPQNELNALRTAQADLVLGRTGRNHIRFIRLKNFPDRLSDFQLGKRFRGGSLGRTKASADRALCSQSLVRQRQGWSCFVGRYPVG